MWESVLAYVEEPSDILHVMQTCRRLFSAGLRQLYEHIKWQNTRRLEQNLMAWQLLESRDPKSQLFTIPRSLTIANYRPLTPPPRLFLEEGQAETASTTFSPAISSIAHRISTFTNLSSLMLLTSTIPEEVYLAILDVPYLRRLHIEDCMLPRLPISNRHLFCGLHIQELVLRGLRSEGRPDMRFNHLSPLFLSTAPELRSLEVDWTLEAAAFLVHHSPYDQHPFSLSPSLQSVKIIMPIEASLPEDPDDLYLVYVAPLIQFMQDTASITHLSIVNKLPNFLVPNDILPNLRSFSGPTSLFSKLPRRELNHLQLTDPLSPAQFAVLEALPAAYPNLCSLEFVFHHWSPGILRLAKSLLLPGLSDISIATGSCEASEDVFEDGKRYPTLVFTRCASHTMTTSISSLRAQFSALLNSHPRPNPLDQGAA
ncbi:hypothetical protein CCMSSC00406_0007487 [Pleurotus cornucopiae]|uniref:Uncharacterized protein n=1 Tax=Pleurotus cornucopiae TaxID=5321 RepID=A0ACB7J3F0_PLECO|nr:hypothetical protein CCMSSC00406_0007487 [Pleurotus cornucopiae]